MTSSEVYDKILENHRQGKYRWGDDSLDLGEYQARCENGAYLSLRSDSLWLSNLDIGGLDGRRLIRLEPIELYAAVDAERSTAVPDWVAKAVA